MPEAPQLNLQNVRPLQGGWNAQVDQNFALMRAFLVGGPLPARRVYWNSANQPSTGTDGIGFTSFLKDFPPALYQGCTAWVMDPTSVLIGGIPTSTGDTNKMIYSNGTSWYWQSDPTLGALDAAI